jgi:hypothetical protein
MEGAPMAEPFSDETQGLLDAADRAIEQSRRVIEQTRELRAACAGELRAQEIRELRNQSRS